MEFDRVIKLHKVEGPLPIPPRIVHSVGMVAKANGKVRDILDASASGLNSACAGIPCVLDQIPDVIDILHPNVWMGKIDYLTPFLTGPSL